MDERYRLYIEAFEKLKAAQDAVSKAEELRDLNNAEKTAREALYNLQFTEGGLAYWVQDTARKRRYEIMTRPAEPVMPVVEEPKEEPKEEEKPKKKTTRRKKKNVVQES